MPDPETRSCRGPCLGPDRRGISALEFGLVAPVVLALLCGAVDTGWQLATELALEHGAHDAARFAMTGNATIPGRLGVPACRADTIVWLIWSEAPALLTRANLQVLTSTDGGKTNQSGGQANFGGAASGAVLYTLAYKQSFVTPFGQVLFGSRFLTHQVQLLVQNEAYPAPGC